MLKRMKFLVYPRLCSLCANDWTCLMKSFLFEFWIQYCVRNPMMRLLGVSGGCALLFKSLGCDIIVIGYLDCDAKEVNCFVWLRDLQVEDTKSNVFSKSSQLRGSSLFHMQMKSSMFFLLKKKRLSLYLGIIVSSSFNAQYIVAYFTVHVIPMAVPCFCKKKHSPKVNVFLFQ